jgi:hypothetical protein
VRQIRVGCIVRVESCDGQVWTANATHVSDRIIGLRGWSTIDGRFRERDMVTLLIGGDDRLMSVNARVLGAGGTLMRVVRRDDSIANERRRAPRLRVEVDGTLAFCDARSMELDASVIDLSSVGCAVRANAPVPVGIKVRLSMHLGEDVVAVAGTVVRTWIDDVSSSPHAGIQFDSVPVATARRVHCFLVQQLQSGVEPLAVP